MVPTFPHLVGNAAPKQLRTKTERLFGFLVRRSRLSLGSRNCREASDGPPPVELSHFVAVFQRTCDGPFCEVVGIKCKTTSTFMTSTMHTVKTRRQFTTNQQQMLKHKGEEYDLSHRSQSNCMLGCRTCCHPTRLVVTFIRSTSPVPAVDAALDEGDGGS